jgi:two-component system NtrC family sensor kinase
LQSEKLASIGILAAGLAHEINNPSAFVIGNVELLRDDAAGVRDAIGRLRSLADSSGGTAGELRLELADALSDPRITHFQADSAEMITDALEGALRIRGIVSSLKGFARQDRGEFRAVDVNDEVDKATELLRNEWKYKCEIIKVRGNVPTVNGNASQIEQVLVNILMNAIQSITKSAGRIEIKTFLENSMVCISLSDDGHGIPADCMNYIFDPFFTTKDIGVGTGLGLSIAHGIVQSHQGRIDVHSDVGVGTTFTVRLPA